MNGLADDTHGGLHHSWVALILLPLAGNVTDHVMTVSHTFKNDLDRAISLAFGGSVQMALLVIPFLVLLGWMIGKPLTLLFDPFQIIVLFVTSECFLLDICSGLLDLTSYADATSFECFVGYRWRKEQLAGWDDFDLYVLTFPA